MFAGKSQDTPTIADPGECQRKLVNYHLSQRFADSLADGKKPFTAPTIPISVRTEEDGHLL
jgi:hypothetical protein